MGAMSTPEAPPEVLATTIGDFPLYECRLAVGGQELVVLYTGAVVTPDDELSYLDGPAKRLPYGVVLWPGAIALAHEIANRSDAFRGRRVLELGAGTGLPGIVAASLGAQVVQTDRQELALFVCRKNGERNGGHAIEYRLADWSAWDDTSQYNWIIGSDILYADTLHPRLRQIFERNLAPGGRVLVADPFRGVSLGLLEAMEGDGWRISMAKWTVGEAAAPRAVGVFELIPPNPGDVH
jgi:methyltransferase-like protein 23